jgi:hypothetical protein
MKLTTHLLQLVLISTSTSTFAHPTSNHNAASKKPYYPPYLVALEEHTVSPSLEAVLTHPHFQPPHH